MRLLELNLGFGTNKKVVSEITEAHSEIGTKRAIAKKALELIKETDKNMIDYIDKNYAALLKSFIKKIYECYSKVSGYEYIEAEPVLKRKKKAGVMINVRNAEMKISETYEMQLYKTKIEAFKDLELYIRKNENGNWILTELSTGMSVVTSYSTKKALETELERISSKVDSIKEKIQEIVASCGHANPHLQNKNENPSKRVKNNRSNKEMEEKNNIETKFEYYEIEQEDFKTGKGYFRYTDIGSTFTVTAENEETCDSVLDSFIKYMEDNLKYDRCIADFINVDKTDDNYVLTIEVFIDDKKEFKKFEKLYKKWKKSFTNSNSDSNSEKKSNGCYWNGNGKYQNEADKISKLIPDVGYTNNKYMNLFIIASNIYYDVYNNGGCNLKYSYDKPITTYLMPFNDQFRIDFTCGADKIAKKLCNKKTLENFFNRVIEIIKDKDLSY